MSEPYTSAVGITSSQEKEAEKPINWYRVVYFGGLYLLTALATIVIALYPCWSFYHYEMNGGNLISATGWNWVRDLFSFMGMGLTYIALAFDCAIAIVYACTIVIPFLGKIIGSMSKYCDNKWTAFKKKAGVT